MMLSVIVWFCRDFDWFFSYTAYHASELSQNLFLALLLHEIVVFPYGVTRSLLERCLVIASYALAVLTYPPSELNDTTNTVLSAIAITLVPLPIYIVVHRCLKAHPAERRALPPLVVRCTPVLFVVALSIAVYYTGPRPRRG